MCLRAKVDGLAGNRLAGSWPVRPSLLSCPTGCSALVLTWCAKAEAKVRRRSVLASLHLLATLGCICDWDRLSAADAHVCGVVSARVVDWGGEASNYPPPWETLVCFGATDAKVCAFTMSPSVAMISWVPPKRYGSTGRGQCSGWSVQWLVSAKRRRIFSTGILGVG